MKRLLLSLIACTFAYAEVPTLCVRDRVGLNRFTKAAFVAEFSGLTGGVARLEFQDCTKGSIPLGISSHAPQRYANALGLAYTDGRQILPELRLFTGPVLKLLGPDTGAATLGRALARVAAHELTHYVRQQASHDNSGLLTEKFSATGLAAKDPTTFLHAHR